MFVFGEVQDPLAETVRLVEDVVRGQIIEIVSFTPSFRTLTGSLADLYLGEIPGDPRSSPDSSPLIPISLGRRPYLPHPRRPRKSQSPSDLPLMERCAKACERRGRRR